MTTVQYEKEYSNVLDELIDRGYYDNSTDKDALHDLLSRESVRFYIGFDATADSLTVGHFIQIMVMMRMQAYGHHPIALLGGGTTMIGDPSGRSDMRMVMTEERINHNASCFYNQLQRFLDFNDGKASVLNNKDWLLSLNFLNFMREVGVHFNVGEMIKKDAYKNRLNAGGLTFFEFAYMLLQSYDFLELYRREHCILQLGGSDQWANIIGGAELIRKAENQTAYGMTFQLLTTADGVKMGKSMKGAVWLDETKTSPYELFQYMRNVDDRDVRKFLLQLTFLPKARCEELGGYTDERINEGKEVLAYEVTRLVHGKEKADEALETSRALFHVGQNHDNMPSTEIAVPEDGLGILAVLTAAGLTKSNGEARRLVQQGGIAIDDARVEDPQAVLSKEQLTDGIVVRKGKKIYLRVKAK
ncbi:MAG: tyrosine--tRNA ligase [Peptoniphilaceae bacterium]|nr:tyrosine--tRNA ligase [Peptoniphilaceae bacterium]MDD7543067.1 tyrosine--tRNA ligase [Peptoniphilaceae bacterium]MDY3075240.1 tyrosine--tRNA ligase [Peptoniphilaceae bacterium]MDY5766445.1 tyrosine--tRNA ligase [Peptoniphilaceae bacterium]